MTIKLNKIAGTHLESVRVAEDIKNGYFLKLGALVAGESELRTATKVVDPTKDVIVFHATPEVMYDPRKQGLASFVVEANSAGRAYHLVKGDVITLSVDLFTATPTVGTYVAPKANSYLLQTATGTELLRFEVVRKTTIGFTNEEAYELQVQ